jgi:hypothetical protein
MYKAVEEIRAQQVQALQAAGAEDVLLTMVIQPIASGTIKACDAKGRNPLGLKAQNHICMYLTGL